MADRVPTLPPLPTVQRIGYQKIPDYSTPDGIPDLYLMNSDASGNAHIPMWGGGGTRGRIDPAFSPDGTRIAFAQNPTGDFHEVPLEIYTMNLDGSDVRRVTIIGHCRQPSWQADMSRIAFWRTKTDEHGMSGIYTIRLNGTGLHRLTNISREAQYPAYPPSGYGLIFAIPTSLAYGIYLRSGEGSDNWLEGASYPKTAWSPDREWIAYSQPGYTIALVRPDGTGRRALTISGPEVTYDWNPAWSPDGQSIVFERFRPALNPPYGSKNIFKIVATQGEVAGMRQLTTGHYNSAPTWAKTPVWTIPDDPTIGTG